jgi:hypothetical protein
MAKYETIFPFPPSPKKPSTTTVHTIEKTSWNGFFNPFENKRFPNDGHSGLGQKFLDK